MATLIESAGRRTLKDLDYIGGLSIQWWAAVRALKTALPFTGNPYRWIESVRQMLQIGVGVVAAMSHALDGAIQKLIASLAVPAANAEPLGDRAQR